MKNEPFICLHLKTRRVGPPVAMAALAGHKVPPQEVHQAQQDDKQDEVGDELVPAHHPLQGLLQLVVHRGQLALAVLGACLDDSQGVPLHAYLSVNVNGNSL